MARRFVTYNTEDQAAGLVNVDERGVMRPGEAVSWNDLTDKPFGLETNTTELYPLTELTTGSKSTDKDRHLSLTVMNLRGISIGDTVLVEIDGESYQTTVRRHDSWSNPSQNPRVFGNAYLFTESIHEQSDTGECFYYDETIMEFRVDANKFEPETSHTLAIYKIENVVTPIPEEFIPDTVQRVGEALTLTSPNGTVYTVAVGDDGALTATAVE